MAAYSHCTPYRGVAERQTRGAQNAVGNARAGSNPAAPTMKEGTMEINEYHPEIAASIASEIRAVAAWLDVHADDLAADTGRMLVVDGSVDLDIAIDPRGPSTVSIHREYFVPNTSR